MKIKYNILSVGLLLLGGLTLVSCNSEGDNFDFGKNGLLITGTGSSVVQSFVVEDTPSSYPITVSSTRKVNEDMKLTIAIDNSLVESYNTQNGTSFYPIPEGAVELSGTEVTLKAGTALSSAVDVSVVSTENFAEGRTYMIPVTIKNVTGSGAELIDASKTIYLKISRVINFYSLENDYRASSNFVFEDSQMEDLTNYTIEFKVYPQTLGTGTAGDNQIQRVLAVEGAKEEEANMFRFGESGLQRNQLQWILPGGRAASKTLFSNNKWYLVSCTYDGSKFVMYVNGVKDVEAAGSAKHTPFQRFEYGMSWGGGYPSGQFFNGRLAEVRVWKRALGASEIVGGLCGVDPKSEGLVAYWKMNQQSGTTILDVTGHGYDMDWTKSKRDKRENGVMADTPEAANYLKWVYDENNKCAQ